MIHALRDRLKVLLPPSARQVIADARFVSRRPTSRYRVMPDFLVIGAMRAGTSSLFRYLAMHPSVIASLRKETRFFSSSYGRGERWYRSHFPTSWVMRVRSAWQRARVLAFEATPDYLFHPYAAARAAKLVPNARLIVLLRNPVDRAVSHYQHMVRLGYETRSLQDALANEPATMESEAAKLARDPTYDCQALRRFSYFSKGVYAGQLETWLGYFPQSQFLAVKSEDFFARPGETYGQVLEFLGLSSWRPSSFRNYSYWGSNPALAVPGKVSETVRRELARRYAPHNERLCATLGRDFGWDENGA